MTQSTTLRPIAKACGITLKTSFNWRHRFPGVLENDQSDELREIIELDETFFRESFKGQKKELPRPARKRGEGKKDDCRKFPVLVARDRSKRTVDDVLETGSRRTLPLFEMPCTRPEGWTIKTRLICFASIPR